MKLIFYLSRKEETLTNNKYFAQREKNVINYEVSMPFCSQLFQASITGILADD